MSKQYFPEICPRRARRAAPSRNSQLSATRRRPALGSPRLIAEASAWRIYYSTPRHTASTITGRVDGLPALRRRRHAPPLCRAFQP